MDHGAGRLGRLSALARQPRLASRPEPPWLRVAGPHGDWSRRRRSRLPRAQSWDQASLIAALQEMEIQGFNPWAVDTGASTHMHLSDGILLSRYPTSPIKVGNGAHILVTLYGSSILTTDTSNFTLNTILVVPSMVCNLLAVHQFTRDNNCSIEYDTSGFSIKDLRTLLGK